MLAGMRFDDYVWLMCDDRNWGDHFALDALSQVLGIRTHVMTRGADASHDTWAENAVEEADIVILFTSEHRYDATAPRVLGSRPWSSRPPYAYAQGVGRSGYERHFPTISKEKPQKKQVKRSHSRRSSRLRLQRLLRQPSPR